MNNFPNPKEVHFLHTSVVNRFVKLLAMQRLGTEAGDHDKLEKEKAKIRQAYIVINP